MLPLRVFFYFLLTASIILIGASTSEVSANAVLYPENGVYSIQPQCAPKREMVVQDANKNPGASVTIWSITSNLNTGSNARWFIERVQGDWYKITAAHSGLALNVDGSNLITAKYSGNKYQLFRFIDYGDGYCRIQPNAYQDYAVDVVQGQDANLANVIIYPYHGGSNQKWKLVRL